MEVVISCNDPVMNRLKLGNEDIIMVPLTLNCVWKARLL